MIIELNWFFSYLNLQKISVHFNTHNVILWKIYQKSKLDLLLLELIEFEVLYAIICLALRLWQSKMPALKVYEQPLDEFV